MTLQRTALQFTTGNIPFKDIPKFATGSEETAIGTESEVGRTHIRGFDATAERRIIVHVHDDNSIRLKSQ
jgi:hypothetical protein